MIKSIVIGGLICLFLCAVVTGFVMNKLCRNAPVMEFDE